VNILHLHPMLVHFPIALFFTSLFFDLLYKVKKNGDFHKFGYYLLTLAVLSGVLASSAGILIEDKIASTGISEQHIDDHKGFALAAMALFIALLAFRFFKKNKISENVFNIYLAFSLVGIMLLSLAAFRGGKLVYEYGAAVQQLPTAEQKK
jgi:uncharacterized membrane protein